MLKTVCFLKVDKFDSFYSEIRISFQAYAKFSGAKVTVSPIDWTWKTLTGELLLPVSLTFMIHTWMIACVAYSIWSILYALEY